jgi:membrane-associated phospholipid phosphatase
MNNPPAIPANPQEEPPSPTPSPSSPPPPPSSLADSINSPQQVAHDYLAFFRGRVVFVAVILLAALFSLLTLLVLRADLLPTSWDITVTHEIQELPYIPIGVVLIAISEPGFQPWNWIIIGGLMAIFAFVFRRPVEAVFIGLAGAGGLLAEIAKNLVDRPRPTPDFANIIGHLTSYSFPSGHVTGYTTLFGFLFYLTYSHLDKRSPVRMILLDFFALMIVLVGFSRVYMGQHWASDALAGYALGFAYLLLLIELYRFWLKRGERIATPPVAATPPPQP